MDTYNKCMNSFLDDFTLWRKHKGYQDFSIMIVKYNPAQVEKIWVTQLEEYKSDRLIDG
ncbi:hypothetical protein LCGC14_2929860 [marine sediment metagenome]|uniref:Uncharacterized protein n=1 Tax=marine sediment metagenome TaxID=412755 RepID=A0A0F8Y851_9ZZZZ